VSDLAVLESANGSIGESKRFLEKWTADPRFKALVDQDPAGAVARHGIRVDPDEVRLLWDREAVIRHGARPVPPSVQAYRDFIRHKMTHCDQIRLDAAPADPRVDLWRRRQLNRCLGQFQREKFRRVVHAPAAFELSRGCSVGCWFCGVAAPRLDGHFRYTEANAALWRDVLGALRTFWGPGAEWAFCYWATDPLDNPDYERFLLDFADVLGRCPQTTTAQPLKDPARTRRVLELSRARGCEVNRFSILTLKMLERVHAEFTADELTWVELVTLNRESDLPKANAGRYRELALKGQVRDEAPVETSGNTIACVSGFLFNMVERTVKLISPCPSDDRWPLGYIVFDEGAFTDGADLTALLARLRDRHMALSIRRDDPARWRSDVAYERSGDAIRLAAPFLAMRFGPDEQPWGAAPLADVADLVATGDRTAGEVAGALEERAGVAPAETFEALNLLRHYGVLDDGPAPPGAGA
jgi:radical SAM family RiPP maturation amino acid epimerase